MIRENEVVALCLWNFANEFFPYPSDISIVRHSQGCKADHASGKTCEVPSLYRKSSSLENKPRLVTDEILVWVSNRPCPGCENAPVNAIKTLSNVMKCVEGELPHDQTLDTIWVRLNSTDGKCLTLSKLELYIPVRRLE